MYVLKDCTPFKFNSRNEYQMCYMLPTDQCWSLDPALEDSRFHSQFVDLEMSRFRVARARCRVVIRVECLKFWKVWVDKVSNRNAKEILYVGGRVLSQHRQARGG